MTRVQTPPRSVPAPDPAAASAPAELRPRDIGDLTLAAGYPSISVLMPTEPAPRMLLADVERLQEQVREVRRQLLAERVPAADRLLVALGELADQAARMPTDRGLAVYVNLAVARTFRLPLAVDPQAVVEQTFATRELVRVLHRTPPHVVLVLHATCAHLYQASAGSWRLVTSSLPLSGTIPGPPTSADSEPLDAFLDDVDRKLGSYRSQHPSPLVLAGTPRLLDRFGERSRHLHRLAGRVSPDCETPEEIAEAVRELLGEYLRSRRADALATMTDAITSRPGDVARGMAACWAAVHATDPQMLLVEEGFRSPGRRTPDGGRVHDLVDDLIEIVILRGGQLAIMDADDLVEHDRVVLVTRSARSRGRGTPRR